MRQKETDRDKFVRLATKRVSNALRAIRLIGNLSNRSNYDFTDNDVEKIFSALGAEIRTCRERFKMSGTKNKNIFNLE